jgi:hypothetical protein
LEAHRHFRAFPVISGLFKAEKHRKSPDIAGKYRFPNRLFRAFAVIARSAQMQSREGRGQAYRPERIARFTNPKSCNRRARGRGFQKLGRRLS